MVEESKPILTVKPSFWGFNILASLSDEYILTEDNLLIHSGLLSKTYNRIFLYKISDIMVRQSLFQRLVGIGHIMIISTDATEPKLVLKSIIDAPKVSDVISKQVDLAKRKRRVIIDETGD